MGDQVYPPPQGGGNSSLVVQDNTPTDTGVLWKDTSQSGNPIKSHNGSSWVKIAKSESQIQEISLINSDGFAPGFSG